MDGIVFILNQTGMALAQAQAEIAKLREQLAQAEAKSQ